MTLHQERAAAVRHLVDEAREIEKNGVNLRHPREDRRPAGRRWPAAPSSSRRTSSRSAPTAASIA